MILVLAKVPLAMTSSLPLLAPYVLKSGLAMFLAERYLAAALLAAMVPAGEM
jgi:hypothetical protein